MRAVFAKIVSFLMAIVVLFSTMSFTVDMHYCGDTLVDMAIFHKVETCGMDMQQKPTSSECSMIKKSCCSDKQVIVDGQDELQLNLHKLSLDKQVFVATLLYTYLNLFEDTDKEVTPYRAYKPPCVIKEIYKIDESYLI
ncbi:HYC_CC_PP family protein [Snuella lapsa]|uniref:Uncharacterized protein n=1 Tax=Snuella lapsa TaxID=870481 RepID=A0ABP6X8Y3_9FLAO